MKKLLSLFLVLAIALSLASCNNGTAKPGTSTDDTTKETEVTTEAETTTPEPPLGEYVKGEVTAKVGDILSVPEIEPDISKLNNFYTVSEDTSNMGRMTSTTKTVMSVKGFHDDVTEFVFKQEATSKISSDYEISACGVSVFVFDNVNKTAKYLEARSMNNDIFDDIGNSDDVEDQMNGIFSGILGDGDFQDKSSWGTYDELRTYMMQILGMYSGICFSEYLKTVNPPMEFEKFKDEGNYLVYYSTVYDRSVKFKLDRETGLFDHASFTGDDHVCVVEYSFTEHLHTDEDVAVAYN